jgi:serine/threonine protein kinase
MLAKNKNTGDLCALKIMKKDSGYDTGMVEVVKNEVEIMKSLSHPNIINLLEFRDDVEYKKANGAKAPVFYLALELANGGELFDFIAQTGKFTEEVARFYFHQLCNAFEYLHGNGVSHRDMKPENIMLDSEFNLKVADFGFSSSKALNETRRGTDSYMAPEIHMGQKYSGQTVDLFAAGIILFIMVTQHPPFAKATPKDPHYKTISANRLDLFWKLHSRNKPNGLDFFSESFRDLITSLLTFDPIHRPSLAEIKSHEWYNGSVPTYEEIKDEFTKRKQALNDANMQESAPVPTGVADPSVFTNHTVHRGVGGDLEEDSKLPALKRQVAEYVPEFKRYSQFFSTSSLDDLFNTLALFAEKVTTEFEFADDEYSGKLNVLEEDQKISLTVNILKVDEENKYCVEVVKNSGDRFVFNGIYNKLKAFFGGHANAAESS